MENNSQPNKHKRGSSPQESIEEVYRSWLKRPAKKVVSTENEDSQAGTGSLPASTKE